MKKFKNFKNICKCGNCGSTDVRMVIMTEKKDYELKALTLKQPQAQKIIDSEIEDYHWVCYGDCNDETSVNLEKDGNVFNNNIDLYIEYIATNNIKKNIVYDIYNGNTKNIKEYIKSGQSIDRFLIDFEDTLRFNQYSTLLIFAIECSRWDVVKLLIENGADVNLGYSSSGTTPLMEVITKRRKCKYNTKIEIIDLMFVNGLDISKTDYNGKDYTDKDYGPNATELLSYIKRK